MGTTTDTGLAQMLLQGCQQGTWFVDHPLRLKRGPNFMYMKVTSVGITLIFTWKPECFPQFCHPKKFWILTDRTPLSFDKVLGAMCRIHFSTFKFLVIALLRRGCVGCYCCSRELENVTTDFDKWKKIHFYHTILSFHCGFAKKTQTFLLVLSVWSI